MSLRSRRHKRDLANTSARFVMSLRSRRDKWDLAEISSRTRRDLWYLWDRHEMKAISPRLARDERYFCETNEISPIWKRFLRDKRDLAKNSGRFVISLRSRRDLAEMKDIWARSRSWRDPPQKLWEILQDLGEIWSNLRPCLHGGGGPQVGEVTG